MQELKRLIPNFQERVDKSDPEDLVEFYQQVNHDIHVISISESDRGQLQIGANNALSDDVRSIKQAVGNWLNTQMKPVPSPTLDKDCRGQRGLQHDSTGFLLCPIEFDWEDET